MSLSIFKKNLKARLTAILILVALVPLVAVAIISYLQARRALESAALREVAASTQAAGQDIQTFLSQFESDVLSLSQTPPIQGIIRARANNGLDPETSNTYQTWVEQLNQTFVPMAENKKLYQQIRYLNEAGQEMVRVDFKDGQAIIRSGNNLQDKSLRPYFGETIQLPAGEIYISELNLNRERGKIETPHTPVLRYGTPIHDAEGKRKGIVILNVYAGNFLDRLETGGAAQVNLVSQEGYYLQHPDSNKEFGFDLGKPFNAEVDFTWALSQVRDRDTFTGIDPTTSQVVSLDKIHFDPRRPERYWLLIRTLPSEIVLADINTLGFIVTVLTGTGVAMVVAIALWQVDAITRPVSLLAEASEKIAAGNWNVPLPPASEDEIGQLVNSFDRMVNQIQDMFARLDEQGKQRIRELEAGAEISRNLTTILDLDELLHHVVASIQNAFGYYHVHIYLVNTYTGELVMREGTGEAGLQLKAQGHKLQPGQGIVGRVAGSREGFFAENVEEVPGFFRNPLLPKTRSELAVPLHKGNAVLGVLDMQSDKIGGFSQTDLTLMQSIADQVAVAVENARLFRDARIAAAEAEELSRRLTHETWHDIGDKVEATGYVFTKSGAAPAPTEWLPAMTRAVQQKRLAYYAGTDNASDSDGRGINLAVPLILRGEIIGAIGIERAGSSAQETNGSGDEGRAGWSADELVTIQSVTEQVALALDAARLARNTERAAWRDRMVSESTAEVWSSAEIEAVMKAAVAQLGDKLRASEVVIRLGTEAELTREQAEEISNEQV